MRTSRIGAKTAASRKFARGGHGSETIKIKSRNGVCALPIEFFASTFMSHQPSPMLACRIARRLWEACMLAQHRRILGPHSQRGSSAFPRLSRNSVRDDSTFGGSAPNNRPIDDPGPDVISLEC